jgi:hypothetical protein
MLLPTVSFLLLIAVFPQLASAQVCDASFVLDQSDSSRVRVLPTEVDDTANIQCAIDLAINRGYPLVQLSTGVFLMSSVTATGFNGAIQGTTRDDTGIQVINQSVDCAGMRAAGRSPAAFKFDSGRPAVRFLTLAADRPCTVAQETFTLVHFTGKSANDQDCQNDVIFAEIDRARLFGQIPDNTRLMRGVSAHPEGDGSDSCKQTLLGTLRVNRTRFSGLAAGIRVSMKARADVDIRYGVFDSNRTAVEFVDANVRATLSDNTILAELRSGLPEPYTPVGVHSRVRDPLTKPRNSQIVISDNELTVENQGIGVLIGGDANDVNQNINVSIVRNLFYLSDSTGVQVSYGGNHGSDISSNIFWGNGPVAMQLEHPSNITSGWTLINNRFLLNTTTADVVLGPLTSNTLMRFLDDVQVIDNGFRNLIVSGIDQVCLAP